VQWQAEQKRTEEKKDAASAEEKRATEAAPIEKKIKWWKRLPGMGGSGSGKDLPMIRRPDPPQRGEIGIPDRLPPTGEATLPGRDLEKGDIVLRCGDFDLTADTTPGGGAEIEFVTVPFPDLPPGRERLGTAMDGLTAAAGRLAELEGEKTIPIAELNDLGTVGAGCKDVVVYPWGPLTAVPQATAGIRLDALPALVDVMLGKPPEGVDPKRIGTTLLTADALEVETARKRAAAACAGSWLRPSNKGRGDLEGLLTMILSYLLMGHHQYSFPRMLGPDSYQVVRGPLSISKQIAPLMARTDFAVMFRQVFPTEGDFRALFADSGAWATFVLAAAGLTDGPVFEHGFYKTEVIDGEKVEVLQQPGVIDLDRGAWLRRMVGGVDLLTHAMNPLLHKSFGSIGRGERVGRGKQFGAIVELRRMDQPVLYGKWREVALNVWDVVAALHEAVGTPPPKPESSTSPEQPV
jgi:hypothetical protein